MTEHSSTRQTARRAIADLAAAVDPGAFAPHHRHGHAGTRLDIEDHPHPLAALRAASRLRAALRSEIVSAVLAARASGETWSGIAEGLGLHVDGEPDADAAYLSALGVQGAVGEQVSLLWTCVACGCPVRDLGPEVLDPVQRELGHGEDCARQVRAVIGWRSEVQR